MMLVRNFLQDLPHTLRRRQTWGATTRIEKDKKEAGPSELNRKEYSLYQRRRQGGEGTLQAIVGSRTADAQNGSIEARSGDRCVCPLLH